MSGSEEDRLVCRSYTHARRHPWVIGKVGGFALPTPMSPTQLLVLLGSFLVLLWTRKLWAHLPGVLNLAIQGLVPLVLSWMVRHLRMEGRSPLRMALGAITYASSCKTGVLFGRPYREARATRLDRERVFAMSTAPARTQGAPVAWVPGGCLPAPARRRRAL